MQHNETLPRLSELDEWELVNDDQDLRGCTLQTRSGHALGTIRRMLVDRNHERVAAVVLDDGRAVPVEEIEIRDNHVFVDDVDQAAITKAPEAGTGAREERIPIAREELAVGKRTVERGHVNVRSRIVEQPVSEQVSLREENVSVERRRVNEPLGNADKLFTDRDVEMVERSEEPVVEKRARVEEELVVQKEVRDRTEHIHDTVRHTEVDVDESDGRQRKPASDGRTNPPASRDRVG